MILFAVLHCNFYLQITPHSRFTILLTTLFKEQTKLAYGCCMQTQDSAEAVLKSLLSFNWFCTVTLVRRFRIPFYGCKKQMPYPSV